MTCTCSIKFRCPSIRTREWSIRPRVSVTKMLTCVSLPNLFRAFWITNSSLTSNLSDSFSYLFRLSSSSFLNRFEVASCRLIDARAARKDNHCAWSNTIVSSLLIVCPVLKKTNSSFTTTISCSNLSTSSFFVAIKCSFWM